MEVQINTEKPDDEEATPVAIAENAATTLRFYVAAPSVSAVRRALHRAPGGARVMGRHDRRTIACSHTMDAHSFARHWPIIVSRLEKAGLSATVRPSP